MFKMQSDEGRSLKKQVGKVIVRCEWYKNGCTWIRTFSDHATHAAFCLRGIAEFKHQTQKATNHTITTQVSKNTAVSFPIYCILYFIFILTVVMTGNGRKI